MRKSGGEIFTSPYRKQVINALKKATDGVFDKHLPEHIGLAVELGCGTGFFYQELAPECFKSALVGYDVHVPSLELFKQSSPDAQVQLGDMAALPYEDASVDLMVGFSAYPLLTKVGVINEMGRVLRPGGKVIAFHDSPILSPWEDDTVYDQMKRVETTHQLLKQKFSRKGWDFVDGFDPIEEVVVSLHHSVEKRIQDDMAQLRPPGNIIIATTNDTGISKVHYSHPDEAVKKWKKIKEELGNPRSLENVVINFGQEAAEYARIRYLVAERKG